MIRNLIVFGTFALASLTVADFASAQVTTNAAMKALAAGSAPYIQRAGYYAAGDGGGALYRWDKTSTCTDDGGSCIMPNRAPAQGRWLLDNNGAVSVKVFGARCDGIPSNPGLTTPTDDTVSFNAALAARSAVFVPANTVCGVTLNSSGDGLKLNNGNHLYGQNQFSSTLLFTLAFTPTYDWISGVGIGQPNGSGGIVVLSNVATVQTAWSHGLAAGQSITIADSADASGHLAGTYTIQAITAPDTFTINTASVPNGTYKANVTSLVTPSGIGVTLVRSALRDTTNQSIHAEFDHLQLRTNNIPEKPLTFIDATGFWGARVHDLMLWSYPGSGGLAQIGIVCADVSPTQVINACFFNHFYDISNNGGLQTVLHLSAHNGNAGTNLFERFNGSARVVIDTTSSTLPMGSFINQWYFTGDGDPNSWDFYPYPPTDSVMSEAGCEGCTHEGTWSRLLSVVGNNNNGQVIDLPSIRSQGGLALNMTPGFDNYNISETDSTIYCGGAQTTHVNLPATPAIFPQPGLMGGQILTFRAETGCVIVIQGNGNLIDAASSFTITAPQTVTMQWFANPGDPANKRWMIISQPAGLLPVTTVSSLPSCGSAQTGMMYAVSDASSPTYNGTLTGSGSTKIPVFCNGSAWTAH